MYDYVINPFTLKSDLKDFTLSNTRQFYLSKGDPLAVKVLKKTISLNPSTPKNDLIDSTLTPDNFTHQRETLGSKRVKKKGNLHPSLHGSLVRHQDMNPKKNQRSVIQGSHGKH